MTFIFGWRTEAGVSLCADTVVRASGRPRQPQPTAFGEVPFESGASTTAEGALKLVRLTDRAAVALCGDAWVSQSLAGHVSRLLRAEPDIDTAAALDAGVAALARQDRATVRCLLARVADQPELLGFNIGGSGQVEPVPSGSAVAEGSIVDATDAVLPKVAGQLWSRQLSKMPPLPSLVFMLAVMQLEGLHGYNLKFGAGGAFLGLHIGREGFHWMPETAYVLYDEDGLETETSKQIAIRPRFIQIAIRNNAAIVKSPLAPNGSLFANTISTPDPREWWAREGQAIIDELAHPRPSAIVFLSTQFRTITAVWNDDWDNPRWCQVRKAAENTLDADLSGELVARLRQHTPPPADGAGLGYTFHWCPPDAP